MDLSQIEFMKCISSIHLNEWSTDIQPSIWYDTDILNDIVYKTNLLHIYSKDYVYLDTFYHG